MERRFVMTPLLNVVLRNGGDKSPNIGFTSNIPLTSEVILDWVTVKFASDELPSDSADKKRWFVLRATYQRLFRASKYLEDHGIPTFIPMRVEVEKTNGKVRNVWHPFLSNLLFVYTTAAEVEHFVRKDPGIPYISYYYDHSLFNEYGMNPPMTVGYSQMRNFILLTSVPNPHTMMLQAADLNNFKDNTLVEVIDGEFKGLRGRITRYRRQTRIAVDNVGMVFVSGYIPKEFMRVIEPETLAV